MVPREPPEGLAQELHMRVFTPDESARHTQSKYLGVLVAAKYARELNALPRETLPLGEEKKLTTKSLEALTSGQIEFRLVARRRREG
jgi:DNA-directed RNA polymerase omega subunit